jgi:hypothetical protein
MAPPCLPINVVSFEAECVWHSLLISASLPRLRVDERVDRTSMMFSWWFKYNLKKAKLREWSTSALSSFSFSALALRPVSRVSLITLLSGHLTFSLLYFLLFARMADLPHAHSFWAISSSLHHSVHTLPTLYPYSTTTRQPSDLFSRMSHWCFSCTSANLPQRPLSWALFRVLIFTDFVISATSTNTS